MFHPETVTVLRSLHRMVDLMLANYYPASGAYLFAVSLGTVLGACGECERDASTAPLESLVEHLSQWAGRRQLPDGRNIKDVVDKVMAEMNGTNN